MLSLWNVIPLGESMSNVFILKSRPTPTTCKTREHYACDSCRKGAGRHHRMSNCSRRKQCMEKGNCVQCAHFHHPSSTETVAKEQLLLQLQRTKKTDFQSLQWILVEKTTWTSAATYYWTRELN
jgi:hypothetical protein